MTCPSCGDVIDYYLSEQNDSEFYSHLRQAEYAAPGVVIGYCGGLPTPETLYYTERQGPGVYSIYLMLSSMLGLPTVEKHKICMRIVESGIIQYQDLLPSVYRMLRGNSTNVTAVTNKVTDILGIPQQEFKRIDTVADCYSLYDDLVKCVGNAIGIGEEATNQQFDKMFISMAGMSPAVIAQLAEASWSSEDIRHQDVYRFLYPQINKDVQTLQILLPAFILDQNISPDCIDSLFLVTASCQDINNLYENNYKVIVKFLPFLVGLHNLRSNGDLNTFKDTQGNVLRYTLNDFISLSDGKKVQLLEEIPELRDLMSGCLVNSIRNGESHGDYRFDLTTQNITYRNLNGVEYHDRLISVAHKCVRQLRILCNIARLMVTVRIATREHGYPEQGA